MEGIANVARQQQSQVSTSETNLKAAEQIQKPNAQDVQKEMAKEAENHGTKIDTAKDVQDLVKKLNTALAPMNTDIKFGVDSQDIFYVSVIDTKSDRMIRRFPAEQAQTILPKMQEVTGVLFDHKG